MIYYRLLTLFATDMYLDMYEEARKFNNFVPLQRLNAVFHIKISLGPSIARQAGGEQCHCAPPVRGAQ